MIDYLTHYYHRGTPPFRSLSALPDDEAICLMESLFEETIASERFRDPHWYLAARRRSEAWVRAKFIEKGGKPQAAYPVYTVLGSSNWMVKNGDPGNHGEIRLPLSIFDEGDVSFTYPDSMISLWFENDRPPEYYMPDYHGKIFTRAEILAIVAEKGVPEDCWDTHLPDTLAPYIEGQVWNHEVLRAFMHDELHQLR